MADNSALKKVNIGIIGCGNILRAYVMGCGAFDILRMAACADIDMPKAEAASKVWDIPKACTVEELLADPSIEIVINLTVPKSHAEVSMGVIAAGKHVYSEKPLGVTRTRPGNSGGGAREKCAGRRGTGYIPGRWLANLPPGD
jgi:predicted dehydrogenase